LISTKVVRWMIAILATIIMLIFLAIVGALVEEGRNIIARVLWILATVFFSAALILRLQEVLLGR
jgi:hypothetical protein